MVFAGSRGDFDELTKENREWVAIQPFKNSKGDQALYQVTFFDGVITAICVESMLQRRSQVNIFQIVASLSFRLMNLRMLVHWPSKCR